MRSQSQRLLHNVYPMVKCSDISSNNGTLSSADKSRSERYSNVQIPIEREIPRCNSVVGFMECQIKRLGRNDSQRQYLMTIQLDGNDIPLFLAEREKSSRTVTGGSSPSRFIIRLFKDDSVLGDLTKSGTARDSTITYTLTHRQSQHCPVAYIRYEVPSIIQVLKDIPSRRAFLEVPGRGTAETKEPSSKENGPKYLNFQGRGREASRKNMQLQSRNGKVIMQFVKWDKDVFHLDFGYVSTKAFASNPSHTILYLTQPFSFVIRKPFDAYHAFGFALAQFDL